MLTRAVISLVGRPTTTCYVSCLNASRTARCIKVTVFSSSNYTWRWLPQRNRLQCRQKDTQK